MPHSASSKTFLDAAELVLRASKRPLSARELVADATALGLMKTSGLTPHKTMGARLAEEIRDNPRSRFMRAYHGQYALTEWSGKIAEFHTKPRKINPLDENVLVVSKSRFEPLLSNRNGSFFDISLDLLLNHSISCKRIEIEENNDFVQIISLFHILCFDEALTYKRTSRLPEARLHHRKSINFGGHLQDIDRAPLIERFLADNISVLFMRELYEELKFENGFRSVEYIGCIHSKNDDFSSRHVGVCFAVMPYDKKIESNEPGFHTDVKFMPVEEIRRSTEDFDEWTMLVLNRVGGGVGHF